MDYPVGFDHSKYSRKPICGVLSVAIIANVSFDVAHAALKNAMKVCLPHRKRFGGSINLAMYNLALDGLAVKYVRKNVVGTLRLSRFAQVYAKPGVLYAVRVPGHIMTMRDGMVIDQHKHLHWSQLKSDRKVTHYYEILGKGW